MTTAPSKDPNHMTRDQRRHLIRRLRAAWLAQQKTFEAAGPMPREIRDALKKVEAWHQRESTQKQARLRALVDHHSVAYEAVMFGNPSAALEAVKAFEKQPVPTPPRKGKA